LVDRFLAQTKYNLFEYLMDYKFPKAVGTVTFEDRLSLFVEIAMEYQNHLEFKYRLNYFDYEDANKNKKRLGYTIILPNKQEKKSKKAEDFGLPRQTHDIFAIMARGHFISSNGSKDNMGRLYDVINSEENFPRLQAYFNVIKYNIERGNNYFYFSRLNEGNSLIEKKLETFERYIDVIDLFASMDNKITIGSRFRPAEIAEECNANVRLKQKLQKIPMYRSETMLNKVRDICDLMARDSYLELEDENTESYKVLDAYTYLLDVINAISIYEESTGTDSNSSGIIYN
jgi:beta-galactosidase beta subunit